MKERSPQVGESSGWGSKCFALTWPLPRSRTWAATANKATLALPSWWQFLHISRQVSAQASLVVEQETRDSISNLAVPCREGEHQVPGVHQEREANQVKPLLLMLLQVVLLPSKGLLVMQSLTSTTFASQKQGMGSIN